MDNIRNIIESLLFVADEPLSVAKLKAVLETVDTKEIKTVLHSLADQYEVRGGGFCLSEVAGGWQLRTRPEYHEWVKRLLQPSPQRLSKAALETLAIVAYNQPIIRADVEHIRGVDCGGILRQLMERKLVRVLGRKEIPGRPLIYATSKLFLELFDLKDLKDLPTPKEIEEMALTEDGTSNQSVDTDTASLRDESLEGTADAVDGLMDDSALFDLDTPRPVERRRLAPGVAPAAKARGQRQWLKVNPLSGIVMAAHPIPGAKAAICAAAPAISTTPNTTPSLSIRISGGLDAMCSRTSSK
jgi:segregation and condensation protein B